MNADEHGLVEYLFEIIQLESYLWMNFLKFLTEGFNALSHQNVLKNLIMKEKSLIVARTNIN